MRLCGRVLPGAVLMNTTVPPPANALTQGLVGVDAKSGAAKVIRNSAAGAGQVSPWSG